MNMEFHFLLNLSEHSRFELDRWGTPKALRLCLLANMYQLVRDLHCFYRKVRPNAEFLHGPHVSDKVQMSPSVYSRLSR